MGQLAKPPNVEIEERKTEEMAGEEGEGGEDEEQSFEELGVDPRLIRALGKNSISKPTEIQRVAIPLINEGKDIVARARTGSGKTYAYLLPMLQRLLPSGSLRKIAFSSFILVPTRELCQQVYSEALSILEFCRSQLKVVQLTSSKNISDMRAALAGQPDILVSTPACISTCMSKGILLPASIKDSLEMLVLDEADLLLSYGYENDLKALIAHVPTNCQCLLMSATMSPDVEKLKKLLLNDPVTLTLSEAAQSNDEVIPKSVQQFLISCRSNDKLLYLLALLQLELVQKKVLIFVNSIDMGFRLKLFLEKFSIRSAVLNAELPQNSRLHILEEFNAGLFDHLIATDDSKTKERDQISKGNQSHSRKKEQTNKESQTRSANSKRNLKQALDSEFGVVRGIDFKNVFTVINFDMPQSPPGYIHRIGRTGRAHNTGTSVSLVSPEESEVFRDIKVMLGEDENEDSKYITPFPLLTKNAVESLRYRAEDVAKSVTKIAIREARAQDLRNEILNSEKLKAHFEANPRDLDLLKHDKLLGKKAPPPHLREVPEYLLDPTTQEASKIIKLSKAAMGIGRSKQRPGSKRGFGRSSSSRDPLKTFSAEGRKSRKDKRSTYKEEESGHHKKKKTRDIS